MSTELHDEVLSAILQELRAGDGLLVIHEDDQAPAIRAAFGRATWMLSAAAGGVAPDEGWNDAWQDLLDRHPGLVQPADERSNAVIADVQDLREHLLQGDLLIPMHLTGRDNPRGFTTSLARAFGKGWRAEIEARRLAVPTRGSESENPWDRYEGESLIKELAINDPSAHLRFDETLDWLLARASQQAPIAVICFVDEAEHLLGSQSEGWQIELAESWRQAIDRTRGRPVRFLSVLAMSRSGYARAITSAAFSPISTVLSRHRHTLEV